MPYGVIAILSHLGGITKLYEGGSSFQQVTMIHHRAGKERRGGEGGGEGGKSYLQTILINTNHEMWCLPSQGLL